MELKNYQRRVVDEAEAFLRRLETERASNPKHAAQEAWPASHGRYEYRRNGLGEDLPTFCIKVPTGGGKTLMATQFLGSIHRTILKDRNGAGLVLWVVPSSQIYRDTLRRLRDRNDMYRMMLEHAVSRRIEVWEKHEIARLSRARLRDCLNILVIQLASTNRETKEQLKFFKDSGGNIVDHFPPENDPSAHEKLKEKFPNLECIEGTNLLKTSVGNLVRLCRPAVILDEGHKATSELARTTIEGFNASIVVELSATPKIVKTQRGEIRPNVLCRVSGQELLDEEMIKLPLNIASSGINNWKDLLTRARDKRAALAEKAAQHARSGRPDRLIRPIVLVQVERTGKDQVGKGFRHANEVRDYLMQRLDVPECAIRIKSAENDGLEDVDLLDPGCPVEWIITKSALQEGWDCPYAYILVSLNKTGSGLAMTQLVGRILRQPFQQRTPYPELNESYVYCLHQTSNEIARQVKTALEKEGYEGDLEGLISDDSDRDRAQTKRTVHIREHFLSLYSKPFKGKVYLPHFCVKEKDGYRKLDYYHHLLADVDVDEFEYDKIHWHLSNAMADAKDRFYRVDLGQEIRREYETEADLLESDEQVVAWLVANLKFDYLSFKQLRRIVQQVCDQLVREELQLRNRLGLVKFVVRDKVEGFIQEQLDKRTEAVFAKIFEAKRLLFYLQCADCRFEIPSSIEIKSTRPLVHHNGDQIRNSLFDYVEEESQNEYEKAVALCLDKDANVLWWYRNLVGPEHFSIQGYKRYRIRPDFVVQSGKNGKPIHRVVVIESKGSHLEGNPDTTYKRNVANYFNEVGQEVTWQQLGKNFADHVFRFQILDQAQPHGRDWKDDLSEILSQNR